MAEKKAHRALAEYLRDQAEWRLEKYLEYGDRRYLTSAVGLEELAVFVLALPEDDARLQRLDSVLRLSQFGFPWFLSREDRTRPEPQDRQESAEELVASFRFEDPGEDCQKFLDGLVRAAEADAAELHAPLAPALAGEGA
jgi:hypothetical protein